MSASQAAAEQTCKRAPISKAALKSNSPSRGSVKEISSERKVALENLVAAVLVFTFGGFVSHLPRPEFSFQYEHAILSRFNFGLPCVSESAYELGSDSTLS